MKTDTYYMMEDGKILHRSGSLSKLINFSAKTTNAIIVYNNNVVWAQNPAPYIK